MAKKEQKQVDLYSEIESNADWQRVSKADSINDLIDCFLADQIERQHRKSDATCEVLVLEYLDETGFHFAKVNQKT